jgi:hypothetical protein
VYFCSQVLQHSNTLRQLSNTLKHSQTLSAMSQRPCRLDLASVMAAATPHGGAQTPMTSSGGGDATADVTGDVPLKKNRKPGKRKVSFHKESYERHMVDDDAEDDGGLTPGGLVPTKGDGPNHKADWYDRLVHAYFNQEPCGAQTVDQIHKFFTWFFTKNVSQIPSTDIVTWLGESFDTVATLLADLHERLAALKPGASLMVRSKGGGIGNRMNCQFTPHVRRLATLFTEFHQEHKAAMEEFVLALVVPGTEKTVADAAASTATDTASD